MSWNYTAARWPDEEAQAAKTMWLRGLSASQIATALPGARTRNAVIGKLHRMGLMKGGAPTTPYVRAVAVKPDRRKDAGAVARRRTRSAVRPANTLNPDRISTARAALKGPSAPPTGPVPPMPKAIAHAVTETAVSLFAAGSGRCKFPVGEPERPALALVCGAEVSSPEREPVGCYCDAHQRLCLSTIGHRQNSASDLARSLRRFL